jgi:glycosyltransferase involved in cell wall biosynthesis
MKKAPFFSIIIPVYNRADIIHISLDSIIEQTFHDYEIIVVDDGSKDDLKDSLVSYPDAFYVRQENAGQGVARNTGIAHSRGEYICFLDSDDLWEKHYLEHLFHTIHKKENANC